MTSPRPSTHLILSLPQKEGPCGHVTILGHNVTSMQSLTPHLLTGKYNISNVHGCLPNASSGRNFLSYCCHNLMPQYLLVKPCSFTLGCWPVPVVKYGNSVGITVLRLILACQEHSSRPHGVRCGSDYSVFHRH